MTSATRVFQFAALAGLGCCLSCSEPDKTVNSITADGAFELRLEAEKDWVLPFHELPVKVVVESRTGPVAKTITDQLELIANNGLFGELGSGDEEGLSELTVTLNGPDVDGLNADSVFVTWVVFEAVKEVDEDLSKPNRNLSSDSQAEIIALFRDAMARLKIRIVDPPPP